MAFRSVPWNAEVWVDGALIGKTPLNRAELSRGSHQIELRLGEQRVRKIIQVGRRSPDDYSWTAATDAWTAGFRSSR